MTSTNTFSTLLSTNVLLEALPPPRTQGELFVWMANNPFNGVNADVSDTAMKLLFIDRIDGAFMSTVQTSEIAYRIQSMLINGLIDRHPAIDQSRQMGIELMLRREEAGVLESFPWSTLVPRGLVIEGITKQAKTRCVSRYLSSLPQVLTRTNAAGIEMESFKQLVYLVIPMPTDGTKSGFVLAAFLEMDRRLGTDYAVRYGRIGTLETQLVHLVNLLVIHRCGLLIVEEAQEGHSIDVKKFGRDFTLFFMRVMNFGIPLLAIGNPLAFNDVAKHSQTWERMTSCGRFTMAPAVHWDDPNWQLIIDQLTAMTVLPERDSRIAGRYENYWRETGGYVKHAVEIRRHELRLAVLDGAKRVSRKYFEKAVLLARQDRDMELVDALRTRDQRALKVLKDIPDDYFAKKWNDVPLPPP